MASPAKALRWISQEALVPLDTLRTGDCCVGASRPRHPLWTEVVRACDCVGAANNALHPWSFTASQPHFLATERCSVASVASQQLLDSALIDEDEVAAPATEASLQLVNGDDVQLVNGWFGDPSSDNEDDDAKSNAPAVVPQVPARERSIETYAQDTAAASSSAASVPPTALPVPTICHGAHARSSISRHLSQCFEPISRIGSDALESCILIRLDETSLMKAAAVSADWKAAATCVLRSAEWQALHMSLMQLLDRRMCEQAVMLRLARHPHEASIADATGRTPLHSAAQHAATPHVVIKLLERTKACGAEALERLLRADARGMRALDYALNSVRKGGSIDVATALLLETHLDPEWLQGYFTVSSYLQPEPPHAQHTLSQNA